MEPIKIHKLVLDHKTNDFNELIGRTAFPDAENIHNRKIGILVGSRGINNIDRILISLIKELISKGGIPCIIPAMGSHGGGSPKGQISVLERIGVSAEKMGIRVISSKDQISIGNVFKRRPVYVNKAVEKMDYLIGVNRIKPHTRFIGNYESGILKLLSAGLGAAAGANSFHETVEQYGFEDTLLRTSKLLLKKLKFLYFVGIIEDRRGAVSNIEVVLPPEIYEKEKKLLRLARRNMPALPVSDIDLLIVNEMGKNLSGAGIDPCVIGGKKGADRAAKRIYIRRLSPDSEGNAFGMGAADFISERLYRAIDFDKTYKNAISSKNYNNVKMPIRFNSDIQALRFAAESLGKAFDRNLKILWINNTLRLDEVYVSADLQKAVPKNYTLDSVMDMVFDKKGNLKIR